MSEMIFQMRLHCGYAGDKNTVEILTVEYLVNDKWLTFNLDINSPGFDIFTYSLLTCQHMYFRANATESGLILDSCDGHISITTDAHRSIESLDVDFTGKLRNGELTQEKMEHIARRMDLCPVSINLKQIDDRKTSVKFEQDV